MAMWGPMKAWPSASPKEATEEIKPLRPWFWTARFQKCEKKNFCCLSLYYGSPSWLIHISLLIACVVFYQLLRGVWSLQLQLWICLVLLPVLSVFASLIFQLCCLGYGLRWFLGTLILFYHSLCPSLTIVIVFALKSSLPGVKIATSTSF